MDNDDERREVFEVLGWLAKGEKLTEREVIAREEELACQSDSRSIRVEVLGYYIAKSKPWEFCAYGEGTTEPCDLPLQTITDHLLWFVRNEPDCPMFARASTVVAVLGDGQRSAILGGLEAAWQQDVTRLEILMLLVLLAQRCNPERCIRTIDMIDLSEPLNAPVSHVQGLLTLRHAIFESLVRHGKASFLDDPRTREILSNDKSILWARILCKYGIAKESFRKGLLSQARDYALGFSQDLGMVQEPDARLKHEMHTFLGLLALNSDDTQAALGHLAESAKPPYDCTLTTFGPNMDLAEALYAKGHPDAVLSFLDTWRVAGIGCSSLHDRMVARMQVIQNERRSGGASHCN